VAQKRADWGVAIETVARQYDIGFIQLQDEHYDFIAPRPRIARPAVVHFCATLTKPAIQSALTGLGFKV
jgi:putative molybdopterin biosynthesis protein